MQSSGNAWLLENAKPHLRSKRTKTEYNKGKGMPETGCSLLLPLRAVEYRLFGVAQDAFCFAGLLFEPQNHLCERIFIRRDEISRRESSLRENFYLQG